MIREHLIRAHPERDGAFRWRGDGVSRVEGLSDAVFGFAITLLVVSLEVPRSFDDLLAMLAGFPAFAGSFALLVMIWAAHYRFFRRYGLEDGRTSMLTYVLLFVVVYFIYPLKFVFQTFLGLWLGFAGLVLDVPALAALTAQAQGALRPEQWPAAMVVYGAGYMAIFLVFAAMHRHALARADALDLDAGERLETRFTIRQHYVHAGVAVGSMALTLLVAYGPFDLDAPRHFTRPGLAAMIGGFVYMVEGPVHAVLGARLRRARQRLATDRPATAVAAGLTPVS